MGSDMTYLLIYLLIYSMEQSPSWEANRFSASQGIPHILWDLKVNYILLHKHCTSNYMTYNVYIKLYKIIGLVTASPVIMSEVCI
jgi:hypothetical protein